MEQTFQCPRSCRWAERKDLCRFQPIFDKLGPTTVSSHVVKVTTVINDLQALAAAAESIGLDFKWGQTKYKWFGRSVGDYPLPEGITVDMLGKCEHAISVRGNASAYEIGVVRMPDGTYSLLWDFWSGGHGLQAVVGDGCKKLTDEYNVQVATAAAIQQGWQVQAIEGGVIVHHPAGGMMTVSSAGVDATGFTGSACHDALLALNLPITEWQQKPCYSEVQAEIQITE